MDGRLVILTYVSGLALVFSCKANDGAGSSTSTEEYAGGPNKPPATGRGGSGGSSSDTGGLASQGGDTTTDPPSTDGGEGGVAGTPNTSSGPPPDGPPGPRFIGRFTDEGQFAWSGTAIELRFKGSDLSLTMDDWGKNFFEVIVDGKHSVLAVGAGEQTYQLASGLDSGEHELLFYRRTEAFFGPSRFLGFSVPESDWLPSHSPPQRRIEIVSDSGSNGYGVEGPDQNCSFEPEYENNYLAYGEVAGRMLGAEVSTIAWSGIGVYRDNSGNPENNMELRYGRAIPTDDTSTWDFSKWIPQAVLVNLGSNDFVEDDPSEVFEDSYNALLDEIRSHYSDARFYCAVGASVVGSEYSRLKPRVEAIVQKRAASGDNIAFIDFGETGYDVVYGCDFHPSVATMESMGAQLADVLKQDLGW